MWHRKMAMKLPLHNNAASETAAREEYHLTPQDGNIHSQIMVLNGNALTVTAGGDIPPLEPLFVNSSKPIRVAPFSIVFIHIPDAFVPVCS